MSSPSPQARGCPSPRVTPAPRRVPLSLPGARRGHGRTRGVSLAVLVLLALHSSGAVKVGNMLLQAEFYQRAETLQEEAGQFMFDFDGDELFHVDLQKTETIWRLPEFGTFATFEAQGALQNMAVDKGNMEIMMKRTNRSQGTIEPPEVTVFSEDPVELGDPNVLICYVDKFWPPLITIKWLKNGQVVTTGVVETIFYPREDNAFRKFSYLPFIPTRGDYYDCQVEHWGLPKAVLKHWEPQVPLPVSESTETLVCALGLAVGIVGIIVGTVLIIKAMKMNSARTRGVPSEQAEPGAPCCPPLQLDPCCPTLPPSPPAAPPSPTRQETAPELNPGADLSPHFGPLQLAPSGWGVGEWGLLQSPRVCVWAGVWTGPGPPPPSPPTALSRWGHGVSSQPRCRGLPCRPLMGREVSPAPQPPPATHTHAHTRAHACAQSRTRRACSAAS
ncbi:LOW QUALITY PROTEIN: HLA class II histocompatibility antigen, DR alpha chain-like [Rhea pennata]|uniref:LOW QUALITY PROTEIN: HLA class II histocompatibility antigen, DR alpha chain-like n=1 Tax=Rhea pennata TaxID=8795 RepID=UPI002E263F18